MKNYFKLKTKNTLKRFDLIADCNEFILFLSGRFEIDIKFLTNWSLNFHIMKSEVCKRIGITNYKIPEVNLELDYPSPPPKKINSSHTSCYLY